jgi:hypothetical protein
MQGVEVRHPVEAKDHSFAVDHKPLLPGFSMRLQQSMASAWSNHTRRA